MSEKPATKRETETFKVMGDDGNVVEVKGEILAREKKSPPVTPPPSQPQ